MKQQSATVRSKYRLRQRNKEVSSLKRKQHKVYYTDDEWQIVNDKAAHLNRETSVYIREISLGYKPVVPDPEFRHSLMQVSDDIRKLFAFLKGMNLTQEDRLQIMSQDAFLNRWKAGVEKELNFINEWIKRV